MPSCATGSAAPAPKSSPRTTPGRSTRPVGSRTSIRGRRSPSRRARCSRYEVPVGFKWFVDGLLAGKLGFAGEESAGSSFLRRDGTVWTTDKDGIVAALLAAEITARTHRDPGEVYRQLTQELGDPVYERIEAPATAEQKAILARLTPKDIPASELAGDTIETILTTAPGDGSPIGGVKVISASGWFAARPSGTEEIYKIYAESYRGQDHLRRIEEEAQAIVGKAFTAAGRVAAG